MNFEKIKIETAKVNFKLRSIIYKIPYGTSMKWSGNIENIISFNLGHDIKNQEKIFVQYGDEVTGIDDVALMKENVKIFNFEDKEIDKNKLNEILMEKSKEILTWN